MDLITSELTIIIGGVMLLIGIGIGMMVDNSRGRSRCFTTSDNG